MPQTEYEGSKHIALLTEARNLGARGVFFRAGYELSKKLGFAERKHPAGELSAEDVIRSLDLENPALADVRRAYNSHRIDRAVAELIKHFRLRESPRFFFDWRERDVYQKLLKESFAEQEAQLIEEANRICRHEFEIFGSQVQVDAGRDACAPSSMYRHNGVNWHLDPLSGRDWPLVHWSRIDVRGPDRIGDVKLTWEMNRHQFFFTLGRAYWFTADPMYAQEFASLMRGWIGANPPEMGINWYSNLEIAVRLISWIWAYHYFMDSPFFDDDLHFDFLRAVLQSCRHITRDFQYSLRSMKNNHVVGDAAALALAGIMFPEFKESEYWKIFYINILNRELDRQVHDDGTDFEQSINYHRFVLYFYLLLFRIMQLNSYDLPVGFTQKLEKMIEFMMYVMKPDGTMSQIGDCDDARVLLLSNDEYSCLKPTLSTGAALFQRGDLKYAAGQLSEETFWLGGKESIRIYDSLRESMPSSLSRSFPQGGYHIMRTGWDADATYLLFKCGPHADHGHADVLHIELHCGGKSRLRDSGTYTYNGSWEWRTFFRSTKAHNTVVVDGESQSIPHRTFRWLKVAKPKTISWITSRSFDYVNAEHNGYSRYKDPVTHRRAVFFVKPEYFLIVDRLIGRGEHSVELLFHTPSSRERRIERKTQDTRHMTQDGLESGVLGLGSINIFRIQDLAIIPVIPDDLEANVYEGSEEPIQGWFSPRYGVRVPSTTLVYSFTGRLPKVMATILDAGCPPRTRGSLDAEGSVSSDEGLEIDVKLHSFSDTLCFNWGSKSPVSQADMDTDAEVVYLRQDDASGKIVRLALISGRYVRLKGELLLRAESPVESIDLTMSSGGETRIQVKPEVDIQLSDRFIS